MVLTLVLAEICMSAGPNTAREQGGAREGRAGKRAVRAGKFRLLAEILPWELEAQQCFMLVLRVAPLLQVAASLL